MDVVFELMDEGAASNTPATVLYDSAAAASITDTHRRPARLSLQRDADVWVDWLSECNAGREPLDCEYAAERGYAERG
jgi:hypothetical protein